MNSYELPIVFDRWHVPFVPLIVAFELPSIVRSTRTPPEDEDEDEDEDDVGDPTDDGFAAVEPPLLPHPAAMVHAITAVITHRLLRIVDPLVVPLFEEKVESRGKRQANAGSRHSGELYPPGRFEPDPRANASRPAERMGASRRSTQELPTGVDRIEVDRSSTRSGDGHGAGPVNLAVIDAGIDPANPDLNVVGGVNRAMSDASYAGDIGHGAHVAGTIGARDDRGGVVRVAPAVRLHAAKVLGANGEGSDASVLCGIEWVTATRYDADPTNDIAVANMSLGGPRTNDGDCGYEDRPLVHTAVCAATAAGVTVVAAAGSSGGDFASGAPANYPEVLTVTALTDLDRRPGGRGGTRSCLTGYQVADDTAAFFGDYATTPDAAAHTVAAPGVCINSTVRGGYDATYSGTSMASPHVAGTVALCIARSACAGLTPAQIVAEIRTDALAFGSAHPESGFAGDRSRAGTSDHWCGPACTGAGAAHARGQVTWVPSGR